MHLRSLFVGAVCATPVLIAAGACRSEPRSFHDEEAARAERGELEAVRASEASAPVPPGGPRAEEAGPARGAALDAFGADPANRRFEPDVVLQLPLREAWAFETESPVSHRPLVRNGRAFFADWGGNVYAVDLERGELAWRRQVQEPRSEWPWHGFAGTGALGDGLLFEASAEGVAYALDQETGEVRWQRRFADEGQEAGNAGDLLAHDGLVYVGVCSVEEALATQEGFEPDFRGKVVALDAQSGEIAWERELAQAPATGVAVWSGFALDPDTSTLFVTTSNNYLPPATEWSDAILALNAENGAVRWAHQCTENDVWTMARRHGPDHAFAGAPQLFQAVDEEGRSRDLVGAGQKSGVYHAFDRETGEKVWESSIGYGGVGGGIMGEAGVGSDRICVVSNDHFEPTEPLDRFTTQVKAIDPATGEYLWVRADPQPPVAHSGDFLAGDLFLTGSCDGRVRAYDAANGELVWTSPAHAGIASALQVSQDTLLFGTGLPASFGGVEGRTGVFAYSSRQPIAAVEAAMGERERGAAEAGGAGEQGAGDEVPQAILVVARDLEFHPDTIEATPGEAIVLRLANEGEVPHNIEIELPDGEVEPSEPVQPGGSATLRFTAPSEPGVYVVHCPVADHRERGMTGRLVVRSER